MKCIRIRIPAKWLDTEGTPTKGTAEFKLGIGPCGKEVVRLALSSPPGSNTLEVIQDHSDGSFKIFLYRLEDVTGRVESEWENGDS